MHNVFWHHKRLNVSQSFCSKSWVVKMTLPQMRVIKGAGVHHYHHYHYHYHLHLDALPLSKLLGIYFRKMRLIRIFTVILGRTMRGLSCTFPMTQGQDGFSILFLFNREGNATLSLYSSHILLYPTFHHLHHIYTLGSIGKADLKRAKMVKITTCATSMPVCEEGQNCHRLHFPQIRSR